MYFSIGVSISRSSFAKLRPKHVLYKRTLPHRTCLCVIHENVCLLLDSLSRDVPHISNDLHDYTAELVCSQDDESCMMSDCAVCKHNFDYRIARNVVKSMKIIEWYQWVANRGRTEKKKFSGNELHLVVFNALRISSFPGTISQCVKELKERTPQ